MADNMFDQMLMKAVEARQAEALQRQRDAAELLRQQTITPYQQAIIDNQRQTNERLTNAAQASLAEQQATHKATIDEAQAKLLLSGQVKQPDQSLNFSPAPNNPNYITIGDRVLQPVPYGQRPGMMTIPAETAKKVGLPSEVVGPISDLAPIVRDVVTQQHNAQLENGQADALKANKADAQKFVETIAKYDKDAQSLFASRIATAQTAQQLESVLNGMSTFHNANSPAARSREYNKAYTTSKATHQATIDAQVEDALARADNLYVATTKLGTPPEVLFRGYTPTARMAIVDKWVKDGKPLPIYLTQAGQKALTEIDTTKGMAKSLQHLLETTPDPNNPSQSLKDSNMPFGQAASYLEYRLGKNNPLSPLISQMLVFRVQGAGRIGRGVGISTQMIEQELEKHTPSPTDAMDLAYTKLQNMDHYMDIQKTSVLKNSNKYGMIGLSGEFDETPSASEAKPSINDLLNQLRTPEGNTQAAGGKK